MIVLKLSKRIYTLTNIWAYFNHFYIIDFIWRFVRVYVFVFLLPNTCEVLFLKFTQPEAMYFHRTGNLNLH